MVDSTPKLSARIDERMDRVEALMRSQAEQVHTSQSKQLGSIYEPPTYRRRRLSQKTSEPANADTPSETIGIGVTQYTSSCTTGCRCVCHKRGKTATPQFVNRVLGQLFVGYTGMPLLSPKCDSDTCKKAQTPNVSLEYWFPLGFFWSQILRLQLTYQPNIGPQAALSTLRQVSDSSMCVDYALSGNIEGLKDLFKKGMASPRDVSSTRGYTLLRVSWSSSIQVVVCVLWQPINDPPSGRCMASDMRLSSSSYTLAQTLIIGKH